MTPFEFSAPTANAKAQTKFDAIDQIEYLIKLKMQRNRDSNLMFDQAKELLLAWLAPQIGKDAIKSYKKLSANEYTQIERVLAPYCAGVLPKYL